MDPSTFSARESAPEPISLRDPAATLALLDRFGHDWRTVNQLVEKYGTWEALLTASRSELAFLVGGALAAQRLPQLPPSAASLPPDVRVVVRGDHGWPSRLTDMTDPPPMLLQIGNLPPPPYVTVGGPLHPSEQALQVAAAAGERAAARGIQVVAIAGDRTGEAGIRAHLDGGGRPVLLAPGGIDTLHTSAKLLLDQTRAAGGAGIALFGRHVPTSDATRAAVARVAATLGSAVVLAELGYHVESGTFLANAAIAASRYLIVPKPACEEALTLQQVGGASLASTHMFSETLFGTSPRIERRLAAGMSPADAVVVGPGDLDAALSYACGSHLTPKPDALGWIAS